MLCPTPSRIARAAALAAAIALSASACGEKERKTEQSRPEAPTPSPSPGTSGPSLQGVDGTENPQRVTGPKNSDVRIVLAQFMRSSLPSNSPYNSVAMFTVSSFLKDSQGESVQLAVKGELTFQGPGVKAISQAAIQPFEDALKTFGKDFSPTALESISTKAQTSDKTIAILVPMPRTLEGAAAETNPYDFCDGEQRKVSVDLVSEPEGVAVTAMFEWIGQRTPEGLCNLVLDATVLAGQS